MLVNVTRGVWWFNHSSPAVKKGSRQKDDKDIGRAPKKSSDLYAAPVREEKLRDGRQHWRKKKRRMQTRTGLARINPLLSYPFVSLSK